MHVPRMGMATGNGLRAAHLPVLAYRPQRLQQIFLRAGKQSMLALDALHWVLCLAHLAPQQIHQRATGSACPGCLALTLVFGHAGTSGLQLPGHANALSQGSAASHLSCSAHASSSSSGNRLLSMATTPSSPESTKRVFICTECTSQIRSQGLGRSELEGTQCIFICKHVRQGQPASACCELERARPAASESTVAVQGHHGGAQHSSQQPCPSQDRAARDASF